MAINGPSGFNPNDKKHLKRVDSATGEVMKKFDGNKDGAIDLKTESKSSIYQDSVNIPNYQKLKEAEAKKIDANSDGKLSQEEVKAYISQKLLDAYDKNKNGQVSGWEKFQISLGMFSPKSGQDFINLVSSKENISGEELKKFIEEKIDEMGEKAAHELFNHFDHGSMFAGPDGKIDVSTWAGEKYSRDSWTTDEYEGRSGDYKEYTRHTYQYKLDDSFTRMADTNNDQKIDEKEIKEYVKKRVDRNNDGQVSSEEYDQAKNLMGGTWGSSTFYDEVTHKVETGTEHYREYDPQTTDDRPRPPEVDPSNSDDRPRPPSVDPSNSGSDRPRPPAVNP